MRVRLRRFTQEYTNYLLAQRRASLTLPIVQMAEAQTGLATEPQAASAHAKADPAAEARRWNDYGIGLIEQAQYGPASEAFRKANEIEPGNPDYLISAAVAELRTERYGPERNQLHKAAVIIEAAIKLNPTLPRARFYHAVILRGQGRHEEAAGILLPLAREYPRDRQVQRELGATLYALGQMEGATAAFEAVVAVDPTDFAAYQYLAPLYAGAGRTAEAESARAHSTCNGVTTRWRPESARGFSRSIRNGPTSACPHTHTISVRPVGPWGWEMRRGRLSGRYTTRLGEVLKVKAC